MSEPLPLIFWNYFNFFVVIGRGLVAELLMLCWVAFFLTIHLCDLPVCLCYCKPLIFNLSILNLAQLSAEIEVLLTYFL